MLSHYLLTTLRNFKRQKQHFALNLFGLTLGLAAAILVALYVKYELSYDKFQPDVENTYRVEQLFTDVNAKIPMITSKMNEYISPLSQVLDVLSFIPMNELVDDKVKYKNKDFQLTGLFAVSKNITDFLKLEVLVGDIAEALSKPDQLILSQSEAMRLFGKTKVVGEYLTGANKRWLVAAVVKDMPQNSHLEFSSLTQITESYKLAKQMWRNDSYTYVKVAKGTDLRALADEMEKPLISAYQADIVVITLKPFTDIHLTSHTMSELKTPGSLQAVKVCIGLSILLLLIASFNFINMSTAQAGLRAKEVGVRKALGATKIQLMGQFLLESVLIALLGALSAFALVELLLPWFNNLVERNLGLDYASDFIVVTIFIAPLLGLLAGLYPALFITAFNTKRVLNGDLQRGQTSVVVRKSLLVMQAALSMGLIIAVFMLFAQLKHLNEVSVGYDKSARLTISNLPRKDLLQTTKHSFTNQIESLKGVKNTLVTDSLLTFSPAAAPNINWPGSSQTGATVPSVGAGFNLVKTLGLNLLAGRDFSQEYSGDWYNRVDDKNSEASAIISYSMVKMMGFDNAQQALGKTFTTWLSPVSVLNLTISGVVEDIQFASAKEERGPVFFICGLSRSSKINLVLEIDESFTTDIKNSVVQLLKSEFNISSPEIELVEHAYADLYRMENKIAEVVFIFSGLAILLTCIGIFGLASFSAQGRGKEIAVRKVLGATSFSLINLISKEFLLLVLISIAIAFPVTYWLVADWLANFNTSIDQNIWLYILSACLIAFITWLTVAVITFKIASIRPSLTLRYE